MNIPSQVNAHNNCYSNTMHTPHSSARVPSVQQRQVSAPNTVQRVGNLGT